MIKIIKFTNKKILFLVIVIILSIICTNLVLHYFLAPQQVIKYKMRLIVGDHIGFDVSKKLITFG